MNHQMNHYVPVKLFGGALEWIAPDRFIDTSQFRDVPDNQEIFADPNTDQSLIIELLQFDNQIPNENAVTFHFQEVAQINDAGSPSHQSIFKVEYLNPMEISNLASVKDLYVGCLFGQQLVSKFRESHRNIVNIYMAVIRIPHVTTDILITLNDPVALAPQSSSSKSGAVPQGSNVQQSLDMFSKIIRSLRIIDWGLFVPH